MVKIVADEQGTANAGLAIVDDGSNVIFPGNRRGSTRTGSNTKYHDELTWTVIGPVTWYTRMYQLSNTNNTFNLKWERQSAPNIPGDDYAAGIWTDGTVDVGNSISPGYSTEGSISSPSDSIRDNDWLKVVIPSDGKYELRAVPRGNGGTRPLMLLGDQYGQASSELFDSSGHLRRKLKAETYFMELRGSNGDYSLGFRTGWTPPGSEPFMGDDTGNPSTKAWVRPNRWAPIGRLNYLNDIDFFKIELIAGNKHRIRAEGSDTSKGTARDPDIRLRTWNGSAIQTTTDKLDIITGDRAVSVGDANSGKGKNAKPEILVNEGGTYYIDIRSESSSTGTYRLKVSTFD